MSSQSPLGRDRLETVRVLHVDDESAFADVAATFLEREDERFRVETATGVREGLDRLAGADFDCVVSDYDMPGRNGLDFLETVREEHPDLPFVLFTGKGSEEVASDAISAGVTDYLQKGSGTDQYAVLANRITNAVEHYRSQRLVERSRQQLRGIIDLLPHSLYVVDEDGTYRLANAVLADFHDMTVAEVEGSDVGDVLDDAEAARFRETLADVLDSGTAKRVPEVEVADPDGDVHVFAPRLFPYDLPETEKRTVLGVAVDVTERTERELERRRMERRYRATFDDPNILVGLLDTDGTVLDVNRTAMEYVDATPAEVTGVPFPETPWFDHAESVREAVEGWIDRAASGEYVEFEADLRRPDGEPYTVEGVFRPVTDDDGDVVSLIVSDREVTERRAHERELERTTRQFQAVLDTVEAAIFIKDTAGRYQLMNQECRRLFGIDAGADVAGLTDRDLLPDDLAEKYRDDDRRVLEEGETVEIEEEVPSPDGTQFNLTLKSPFFDAEGELSGVCGVSTDITERREREEEIRQKNKRLEEFASIVSHDLRNPLSVAEGRLELVDEECESEHLAPIADALARMGRIVDDVLWLAQSGRDIGETAPVDLRGAIEDAWLFVADDAADARLTYPTDGDDGLGTITADYDRLCQLLENLFRNAVEHGSTSPPSRGPEDAVEHGSTSPPSRDPEDAVEHGSTSPRPHARRDADEHSGRGVTVRVEPTDEGFAITDDGPGIPPAERDRVFEAGYSTSEDGIGFGLHIAKQVAEAHGWDIRATAGPDGGARFELTGIEPG